MIWDWVTKLWPATIGGQRPIHDTPRSTETIFGYHLKPVAGAPSTPIADIADSRTFLLDIDARRPSPQGAAGAPNDHRGQRNMERQRSHKRSSFRMRISRRMRAEFTPVPQHESDSDPGRDWKESEPHFKRKDPGERDGHHKHRDDHHHHHNNEKRNSGPDRLTSGHHPHHGHSSSELHYDNYTDLNVELQEESIGFNFRKHRKSFGSESEKRRGERFLRREIEKKITLDESDDAGEADSSSLDSHVCDVSCPLITVGECPKSHRGKRKLKAPRRSSFTSSTSRDSALNAGIVQSRRLRPLASLSIDDLPGASGSDHGGAARSPGLHSTASMWSTSDLRNVGSTHKPEPDTVSHVGTNSLSNVSGSLGDRMHELVRAFSGRTQRAKEKISQPPTPSSESDCDAKS
ncbi:hypothetical protein Btru_046195, partial [Bulinus truncatus]